MAGTRADMHVDIVINDFGHAGQVRVARCTDTDHELRVDANEDFERWHEIVLQAYERANGDLSQLHDVMHGDYLFATAIHVDRECPFEHGSVSRMPPVGVRTGTVEHHGSAGRAR